VIDLIGRDPKKISFARKKFSLANHQPKKEARRQIIAYLLLAEFPGTAGDFSYT
jgi:hypothetical protein